MSLTAELVSALRDRVTEQISLESQAMFMPCTSSSTRISRKSRAAKYEFEPEHTISQIREYTSRIETAELGEFFD